jgi:hypothetical protein
MPLGTIRFVSFGGENILFFPLKIKSFEEKEITKRMDYRTVYTRI